VGLGRARLDVFRRSSDGSFQAVWHDEEALGAEGAGVGSPPGASAGRPPGTEELTHEFTQELLDQQLIRSLRRFQRVCGRHHVTVGAVAHGSDALNNHPDTLPRLFRMTGVPLRQLSDREAARLLCLGLLRGERGGRKNLVVDVGSEATLVILAEGEEPVALWRLGVGTAGFAGDAADGDEHAGVRRLRVEVRRSLRQTRLDAIRGVTNRALTGRERLGGAGGTSVPATRARAILEEVGAYLRLEGIRAVDRGLREGILFDLSRGLSRGTDRSDA
jgi:exopolyphosphatase/pppGpp-phosphohydrolase